MALRFCTALIVSASAAALAAAQDEPRGVPVRYPEGTTHGFLELGVPGGKALASGDLLVQVKGDVITSRMVFHFRDGSHFEEHVTYSQRGVFRLRDYRLVHRGPAFDMDIDARLSANGRYSVTATERDDDEETDTWEGTFELPPDTYNGMVITIAKNLRPDASRRVHLVAFTPKPRLIELDFVPSGRVPASLGVHRVSAVHFVLKPRLGGVTEFFAKLLNKMPPDSHAWIVTTGVPAFLRFQGPLFTGPVWQIDLVTPKLGR